MKKIFLLISIILLASLVIADLTSIGDRDRNVYISKEDKDTLSNIGITAPIFTNINCPTESDKCYAVAKDVGLNDRIYKVPRYYTICIGIIKNESNDDELISLNFSETQLKYIQLDETQLNCTKYEYSRIDIENMIDAAAIEDLKHIAMTNRERNAKTVTDLGGSGTMTIKEEK